MAALPRPDETTADLEHQLRVKAARIVELESELAQVRAEKRNAEMEAARTTGELDLELRRLRMQQLGAQAEHQILQQRAAEMQHLPWRVIDLYRRLRRLVPEPLIRAVARLIPRRQP